MIMNLTLQERKVLLFLSFLFVGALALGFLKKTIGYNFCSLDTHARTPQAQPLDINQATRDQLIALPDIGPKTADGILAYRASAGRIADLSELKNIKGITDRKLDRLKKYLVINRRSFP